MMNLSISFWKTLPYTLIKGVREKGLSMIAEKTISAMYIRTRFTIYLEVQYGQDSHGYYYGVSSEYTS
jgi:hypothetical protein